MTTREIRDKFITGTFAIGNDGCKEPPDWKDYAIKLEEHILSTRPVDKGVSDEYLIRVKANHDCWITEGDGDPPRTTIKENARAYTDKDFALGQALHYHSKYPNRMFSVEQLDPTPKPQCKHKRTQASMHNDCNSRYFAKCMDCGEDIIVDPKPQEVDIVWEQVVRNVRMLNDVECGKYLEKLWDETLWGDETLWEGFNSDKPQDNALVEALRDLKEYCAKEVAFISNTMDTSDKIARSVYRDVIRKIEEMELQALSTHKERSDDGTK